VRHALVLLCLCLAAVGCSATPSAGAALSKIEVTDPRYKGLVFLVATVRRAGTDFVISNDSTQPWFDVAIALTGSGADEYLLHLDEIDAGQTVSAASARFATAAGRPFDAAHDMPPTLVISAEIGEGGPTGVYAVRLSRP
jgi:hypothetical protein